MRVACSLLSMLLLTSANVTLAADGAIEINQACAEGLGCLPGDATGFPVTVSLSGSYVLTGNLVVPTEGLSAIRVTSPNVQIDLNGFALIGPRVCTGAGADVSCTGPGQNGVAGVRGENAARVAVRNGTIRGFWRGVWLGEQARVAELITFKNAGIGIVTGPSSLIQHNVSFENGGSGLNLNSFGIIRENVAGGNGFRGIRVPVGSVTIERNVAGRNSQNGISCASGCTITRNVSTKNGLHGIEAGNGTMVSGNVACENDGDELNALAQSGYTDNVFSDTRAGAGAAVTGGGVFLDPNLCNNGTTATDCTTAP